jgi:hypothetical protein
VLNQHMLYLEPLTRVCGCFLFESYGMFARLDAGERRRFPEKKG